jgi:hypothetical protein
MKSTRFFLDEPTRTPFEQSVAEVRQGTGPPDQAEAEVRAIRAQGFKIGKRGKDRLAEIDEWAMAELRLPPSRLVATAAEDRLSF